MNTRNKFSSCWLILIGVGMLGIFLRTEVVYAMPGIEVTNSGANFSTALYEETVIDMRVKVLGGEIEVERQWKNGGWVFNQSWVDLKFIFSTLPTGTPDPGATVPESIDRNGFIYRRQNSTSNVYVYDKRKTIARTETGYRWLDREGGWINYDAEGKLLAYGNRNNVKVSFGRDAQGRIETVKDHFNKTILTFAYDTIGRIGSVTDYSGRSVIYTYSGSTFQIIKVKDVRGFEWQYAYQTLLNQRVMSRKTDPEGRVIDINHVISGGGQVCVQTDVGDWVYNEEKNRWEQQGGRCLRWIIQPQSVMLISISDAISKRTENRYFFDADNKLYNKTTISNGRRVIHKINLKGEILGEEINGETQSEIIISTDRRRRVETNRHGHKTAYEYDEYENQTKITYPDNNSESWTYDQYSNVLTHTNENGVTTKNEYDARGNLIRTTEALGTPVERVTEYAYDEYGNMTEMKQLGDSVTQEAITKWAYDEYGNVKTKTDPEGYKAEYTHDVLGNVLVQTDAQGGRWIRTYDAAGNLLNTANPLGYVLRHEYDRVGNLRRSIDALDNAVSYTYDVRDQKISETDAYGRNKTYFYNAQNQLVKITDEENKVKISEFDSYGRLVNEIDGNGNSVKYEYGEGNAGINQVSKIIYPAYTERYYYDVRGRLVLTQQVISDNESFETRFSYDAVGNRIQTIDTASRVSIYRYDQLNRIMSYTNPSGQAIEFSYDNRNNVVSVKNESDVVIRQFKHNRNNQVVQEIWPGGETINYEYNWHAKVSKFVDAKGQVARHIYDVANRLIRSDFYSGEGESEPQKSINYEYNAVDSLAAYDDGRIHGVYTYDKLQRVLSESINYGAFSLGHAYTYTPNGHKASLTNPDGGVVQYTYDAADQLSRISIAGHGDITFNSYSGKLPKQITLPGGSTQHVSYDQISRITSIRAEDPAKNIIMDYSYGYDPVGNIIEKNTEYGQHTYNYDDLDRLTGAQNPIIENEMYTYDAAGNRLSSADASDWQHSDSNQLLVGGSSIYEYDLNGSMIKRSVDGVIQTFSYDLENRLSEVRDEDNNIIAAYTYDPFGRRVSKTFNGSTTYFYYSDEGLIAEYDGNGGLMQSYGYSPEGMWSSDPVYTKINGEYYYYLNDHSGTPQKLINLSGSVQWAMQQSAFGISNIDSQSVINSHLRFPGQYYDQETGLYYNWFRYYDPVTGNYTSSDPISLTGGFNTYIYVHQNPVRFADPNGLAVPLAISACLANPVCAAAVAAAARKLAMEILKAAAAAAAAACAAGLGPCGKDPGNCSKSRHRYLQNIVNGVCKKGPRSRCQPGEKCEVMAAKMANQEACATARKNVNDECFNGGDKTHQTQYADARKEAAICNGLLPTCCP